MQPDADPVVAEQLAALFTLLDRSPATDGAFSRGDFALLAAVHEGPRRAGDVAQAVGLDPSTTSRRIGALLARGLLDRGPDPADGRAHRVGLTEAGAAVLAAERRRRVELVGLALAGWPSTDRDLLADLLARLRAALAGVAGGPPGERPRAAAVAPAADPVTAAVRTTPPERR